jgi:arabinofuranan 3-O-arabinosyltransferase
VRVDPGRGHLRSRRESLLVAALALIAFVPALASSPGRMPADTKLYLYLDPGRLLQTSASTWDPSLYGGWVPHQMVAYLWPSGPWFWLCDRIGLADWVAHRLWLGAILFLGGLGVLKLVKAFGMPLRGMAVAALVYQLSPYVLPYVSRTTVMLLPWMSLGWLILLTMRSVHEGGWRYPALLTLVVCTASPVNATAFAMVLPGPLLWVAFELHSRRVSARQVLRATARIALLAIPASVWWIAMLTIQSRYGADVLAYSESLAAVSGSSSSTEVVRSLGYWLFYLRDSNFAATSSSAPYQESSALIAVGYTLATLCLAGLVLTRFRQRRLAIALVFVGAALSVGFHPFHDPAPLPSAIRDTGIALALRSSTRALPLLSLGMALGAAALAVAIARTRVRWRAVPAVVVVALVAANLPSLWSAGLVDPDVSREQDPPAAWRDAAAALDARGDETRVLQIPGADFGTFRWGFTVDQPVSGLTSKPLVTRDLLPLGSAQLMDLLFALDNRLQAGSLEATALAPLARFLAADTVWVTNDAAFDRFRTLRPELLADMFAVPPDGLGEPIEFGTPTANIPQVAIVDEESVADPRVGLPLAPVLLVPVESAQPLIRLGGRLVVLDGSGDGMVDAAAAGLLDGSELVRYANDLAADEWHNLADDAVIIVTDSNRDREYVWASVQETVGMTESGGPGSDGVAYGSTERLPLFAFDSPGTQTTAALDGGLTVQATTYGLPYSLLPEYRAAQAVDGDPATGWKVYAEGIGESLSVSGAQVAELRLLQLQDPDLVRYISAVDIAVDGVVQRVVLDESSLEAPGQAITLPAGDEIRITIAAVDRRSPVPLSGSEWIGFAEIGIEAQEWISPPSTALAASGERPVALILTRERVSATERLRSDPEPVLARLVDLPAELAGELSVRLRLNRRAPDAVIDAFAQSTIDATSNRRLAGFPDARASAAFDGDPDTAWITPFHSSVGSRLTVALRPDSTVSTLRLRQPSSDQLAVITAVRVVVDGVTSDVLTVPPPDSSGVSSIAFPAASGDELTLEIAAVVPNLTSNERYNAVAQLPSAISEISGLPLARSERAAPAACMSGLLAVDGQPIALAVDMAALLAGESVVAQPCGADEVRLAAGPHHLLSTAGLITGIDVDAITVVPAAALPAAFPAADRQPSGVTILDRSATSARIEVPACPNGCWLIFGEGHSPGWQATVDGTKLSAPEPVSGGANGWFLPPSTSTTTVDITFTPQRTLDIALLLSAAAVAVCVLLVGAPMIRRRPRVRSPIAASPPSLVAPWQQAGSRAATAAAVTLVVGALALVGGWWALAALPVAALVVHRRQLRLAGLLAVVGIGSAGLLVAARQLRSSWPAATGWLHRFEGLHEPVMFLIVLLLLAAFASDERPADG